MNKICEDIVVRINFVDVINLIVIKESQLNRVFVNMLLFERFVVKKLQ